MGSSFVQLSYKKFPNYCFYHHHRTRDFLITKSVSTQAIKKKIKQASKAKPLIVPEKLKNSMRLSEQSATFSFPDLFLKFFTIVIFCTHIWNQHGTCIEMNTNKSMFGPVVLEIDSIFS